MRFSGRFFVVLGGIFLATVVAAPFFKLLIDSLLRIDPAIADTLHLGLRDGVYDYGRVHRRLFMLAALVLILLNRRWLGPVRMQGLSRGSPRVGMLAAGLATGIVSWALLLGIVVALGQRLLSPSLPEGWAGRLLLALVAALLVGLIEEIALRGWLLGGMLQDVPQLVAVVITSALYSVLHFLRAPVPVQVGGFDPAIGLEALIAHLRPLGSTGVLLPFVGLLLVGVVLSYAYLWSRSLPFAIGLHAGWVFLIGCDGFLFEERLGRRGLYGEDGLLASVAAWGFMLAVLFVLRPLSSRLARSEGANRRARRAPSR